MLTLPEELIGAFGLKSRLMCSGHRFRFVEFEFSESVLLSCAKAGDSSNVSVARQTSDGNRNVNIAAC